MDGWLSRFSQLLEKAIFPISRFLHLIGQVILVLMVLVTVSDVFLRYLFNSPILGSWELTEFMMAVLVFASVGYTMVERGHVVVDLVITRLPGRVRALVECITSLIAFLLFAVVTWRNVLQAGVALQRNDVSAELFIPKSPFILFVAVGIGVLSLVLFVQFLESLARVTKK
ncbi:MAG: TRAP transporter small permease [Pseudomonadota bacterium]